MTPRLSLSLLLAFSLPAALRGEEPNAKAARLLEPLARRPGASALFERFVNAWLDTGTLDSLGEYLTKRAAADPSAANRLLLAQFHARQGQPVKALELLRAALAADAGNAETWMLKGQTEARMLDFSAAIGSLKSCLAAHPPEELAGRAAQLLGRVQARAGHTDAALETWSALMKSRPADEDLREDILEIQIAESLWPAALENAAHLAEHTADAYRRVLRRMRLGDVQDRSGQRDKALDTFAACLGDAGAGSWLEKEILAQIDKLFRREDDLGGLRAFLEKQAADAPQRAGVQRALAKLLMELAEPEAALAVAKRLMDLTPGDRTAREEFIAMLTGAGRAAEAIPQVQQLILAAPDDAELRLVLAGLHHEVKDDAAALAAVREFEKLAAADPGTPVRVAALLDKYGLGAEAVATLRAALARTKDRLDLRLQLASTLHKSGDRAAAVSEWQTVAAAGDLSAALQAVRAMQAAGETDAAWALLMQQVPRGKDDAMFLTQLAAMAGTEARAREALPAVRVLVDLAKSAPDLDSALDALLRVARKANAAPALRDEMRTSANSAPQFCLLAALLESERDTAGAAAALAKAKALNAALALSQSVRLHTLRGDFAGAALAAEEMFQSARTVAAAESLTALHRRAGNLPAALQWVQEWRKLSPGAAAPVLEEAALLQSAGREADAIASLRAAAGRMEQNADIRARLAAAYAAAGQSGEAMRLYAALYEEANDLPARMRWLQPWAEAARGGGQLEELIAQFEERRRDNRASTAPLMALAELHRMAGNYEERRKALTEAQRLKPDDMDIMLEIARLEEREGHRAEAIATLRAALPKDTGGKLAQALSEMLMAEGENEEGLALLTEHAATPQQVEAVADGLARSGDTKAAIQFLEPFLGQWPQEWRLHFRSIQFLRDSGETAAAVQRCTGLLTPRPASSAAGPPAGPAMGFSDLLISRMTPDCAALLRMLRFQEQQRARRNFPASLMRAGSMSRQSFALLGAEEVPLAAAQMIAENLGRLPKEAAAKAERQLREHGLGAALLLPRLGDTSDLLPSEWAPDVRPWLKDFPEERAVLMYAAFCHAFGLWTKAPDGKLAQQVWDALHRDSAEAGLFLALPAAAAQPEDAWAAARLAEVESWPAATPLLTMSVLRAAGLDYEAPPPARDRMIALLMRWRGQETAAVSGFAAEVRGDVFTALSREFLKTKNLAALRDLLEGEWKTGAAPVPGLGRRSGSLAQGLGFPPAGLAGVPEQIAAFLKEDELPAVAAELAGLVQAPVLKLLLMAKSPAGVPEAAVAALIAERPGEAGPLLLAASLAEKRGDFPAAGGYAVMAQFLPMDAAMRRRLDGALAWWAQRQSSPGDALHAAGREAALRLRRDALDADDRTELATIMDTLGLTAEADRFMRQGRAALAGGSGAPLERAEKLLREGRSKEALPVLLQQMRGWAQKWMTTGEKFYDDSELKDWRTMVQVAGLMPEVDKAMQPANPTPRQLAEYAALCDLTLRWPEALTATERAAAAPGAGPEVRMWHLRLKILSGPDKAAEHVLASGLQWNAALFTGCHEALAAGTPETAVPFSRLVDNLLKAAPERAGRDFPVKDVLSLAGSSMPGGQFYAVPRIPSKGPPTPTAAIPGGMLPGETARVMALATERAAHYESICRSLLTRPGCGLEAWDHLRHLVAPESILTEGMAAAADALAAKKPEFDENDFSSKATAMALHAVKAGRTAEFEQTVVAPWKAAELADDAEFLTETWPLYACPDAEFVATVKQRAAQSESVWRHLSVLLDVRSKVRDVLPLFLEAVAAGGDASIALGTGPYWAPWIRTWNGEEALRDFLRSVLQAARKMAAGKATTGQASEEEDGSSELMTELVKSFSARPEVLPALLTVLKKDVLPALTEPERMKITANLEDDCFVNLIDARIKAGDLAALRPVLDLLGLNGGPGDVWPPDEETFRPAIMLMELPAKDKESLGFGGPVSKLGFGWQLMAAQASRKTDFWEVLAPWQPQIAALPEAQGQRVAQLLHFYVDMYTPQTAEGEQFRRWVLRREAEEEKAELDMAISAFLRDAEAGEMEDADTLQNQMASLVSEAFLTQPPRMREVIDSACAAAAKLGSGEALSAVSDPLIENAGNSEVDSPQAAWFTGLAAEAMQRGMHGRFLFGYRLAGAGEKLMQGADDSLEGRLAKFTPLAAPQLTQPVRVWMLCWLLDSAGEGTALTEEEVTANALRWVEQHRAENAAFLTDMETALLIRRDVAAWQGGPAAAEAVLLPGLQRLLALLRSDATPPGVRLHAGVALLEEFGSKAPRILTEECARLLLRAHREKLPVYRDAESGVCSALAMLPDELRDAALVKELIPHLQLARPREEITDGSVLSGMNALLDLALWLGDGATADRMLEAEGHFPNFVTLGVLARRADRARLAAIMAAHPGLQQKDAGWGMEFDTLLQAQLPGVTESIAHAGDRMELLALFAALDDPKNAAGLRPRAERIAAMAPLVAAHSWSHAAAKDRAVAALVTAGTPRELLPLLDEMAARVPLITVAGLADQSPEGMDPVSLYSVLHTARFAGLLREGSMAPLLAGLAALEASPLKEEAANRQVAENLMDAARGVLLRQWSTLTPGQRAAACDGWRECLSLLLRSGGPRIDTHVRTGLHLHLLADREQQWSEWISAKPDPERALIIRSFAETDRYLQSLQVAGQHPEDGDQRRAVAGLLTRIARDADFYKSRPMDELYFNARSGSREDFLRLEPAVMAALPGDAWSVFAFARNLARMERWPDVLARTEKALAAVEPSGDSAWLPLVELHVQALARTGRPAEREAWLAKVSALEVPFDAGSRILRQRVLRLKEP